jgi:polyisoprenoid-binding protein YceI
MHTTARHAVLVLTLLLPVSGWRAPSERLTLQTESRLWIEGTSTIKDFSCRATTVSALVDTRSTNAIPQLLVGDKAVVAVDVKVPVEKPDCSNGTMNEHMRNALKAVENPTILFRLSTYEIERTSDGVTGALKGTLSLGGVQRPLVITAVGTGEGEMLHITGSTEIRMTDYALTPPSLMFGRIKVNEKVIVKFDLLLKS